ncbi:fungal-specific transcription factor domain-containing protein [Xylariales sp. PMI_506]|nr:fungal-specific transcription factor domain-containing protein [Xylariales sp. PMI_506]
MPPPSKPCHNCHKRRLRCDRSVPSCIKCTASGQDCLGYGKIYHWTNAVASRGRMAGKKTFESSHMQVHESPPRSAAIHAPVHREAHALAGLVGNNKLSVTLIDPLFCHMDETSRFYLNYFSSRVCEELVVHDSMQLVGNPFRQLIAMSTIYPFLQHILVASSALHFSNALRYSASAGPCSAPAAADALVVAFRARHKAIKTLQCVLGRYRIMGDHAGNVDEKDALLSTIVFFINFSLIDSGKGGWRAHLNAARRLIAAQLSNPSIDYTPLVEELSSGSSSPVSVTSPIVSCSEFDCIGYQNLDVTSPEPVSIRDYVVSDTVSYHIWGRALESLTHSDSVSATVGVGIADIQRLLIRTEANSYHSCPVVLLLLVLRTSRLVRAVRSRGSSTPTPAEMDSFVQVLRDAQSFDVEAWALRISQANSHIAAIDEVEVRMRTCIGATHRAATCLYVLLAAPGLQRYLQEKMTASSDVAFLPFSLPTTEELTVVALQQLSAIPQNSPFYKYATWPVFVMGVATTNPQRRDWVLERLRTMWDLCPWGMTISAIETLNQIWSLRDGATELTNGLSKVNIPENGNEVSKIETDWLMRLKGVGSDFLVV